MGVLEDVLLNAKLAVENVGKKATEIADLSKLKMSAAQLSREISNQFELIGRAVYDADKAGENADALAYELADMERAINGDTACMHLEYTKDVMELMTAFRTEWGLKYPEEE